MSLADLHAKLSQVHESIQSFDVPLLQLPVIDFSSSHERDNKQALPGLRFLREEVKRDCEVLDKFLREHASPSALSTNAPYLIAVWDELVRARQPVAIYRMFPLADGRNETRMKRMTSQGRKALRVQTRAVKVDVVAENGARWVRVNTIKNSRLMMEFREIDSYLTSDEDEDELRPRLAQTEFDNSVLRMGRDLLAAAKANPVPIPTPFSSLVPVSDLTTPNPDNTMTPRVTIRLTRLDPVGDDTSDPRIGKTIQCLRDMGIEVELGERSYPHPAPIQKTTPNLRLLEPTPNINLDLSALIALISDISHSPLPRTEEEARVRFMPPQSYLDWKKDRVKSLARQSQTNNSSLYGVEDGEDDGNIWENSGQHSRALAAQAIQEMGKGILEEIHRRISAVVIHPSVSSPGVTFWTTSEARHRCLQIVSKIGGEKERQRADALLGSTLCTRTPAVPAAVRTSPNGVPRTGVVLETTAAIHDVERRTSTDTYWEHSRYPAGFLHVVPVHIYPSILPLTENEDRRSRTSFFDAFMQTCTGILAHEAGPVSQTSGSSDPLPVAEEVLEVIPPATQASLPKLTVHTVRSMLAGASRGYTTLTTNRSSVKVMLKEMRRLCGRDIGYEPGMGDIEKAALWILDPRSLSEVMRSE